MKQIYEFDTTMQPPEQTQAELETSIGAYKQSEGLDSLQIHQKRTSKAKKLIEGFLTWGAGDLTQGQLDAVEAILEAQPGLVGYIDPTPEPAHGFDCTGIVGATLDLPVLAPGVNNRVAIAAGDLAGSGSFLSLGQLEDSGAGDVYVDRGTNGLTLPYLYLWLIHQSEAGSMTIPAGDLTVSVDGSDLVLANENDIVINGAGAYADTSEWYYIDEDGKLYLMYSRPKGVTQYRTFEDAVAAGAV